MRWLASDRQQLTALESIIQVFCSQGNNLLPVEYSKNKKRAKISAGLTYGTDNANEKNTPKASHKKQLIKQTT